MIIVDNQIVLGGSDIVCSASIGCLMAVLCSVLLSSFVCRQVFVGYCRLDY